MPVLWTYIPRTVVYWFSNVGGFFVYFCYNICEWSVRRFDYYELSLAMPSVTCLTGTNITQYRYIQYLMRKYMCIPYTCTQKICWLYTRWAKTLAMQLTRLCVNIFSFAIHLTGLQLLTFPVHFSMLAKQKNYPDFFQFWPTVLYLYRSFVYSLYLASLPIQRSPNVQVFCL